MFSTPAFKSTLPSSCVCLPALFILPSLFSMTAYSSVRICLSVCPSTCNLSDCLCCHSVHPILSVCLSVCVALAACVLSVSVAPSVCQFICLYMSFYMPLSTCLPLMCLSACFVCKPVYPSACSSVICLYDAEASTEQRVCGSWRGSQ